MKRQDIIALVAVAVVAGLASLLITGVIFSIPKNRKSEVPVVQPIPTAMPDIKNDPTYQAFLNTSALDLTQPVQIGNSQNASPFNSSQ